MVNKKTAQSWLNDLMALAGIGADKKDSTYPYLQGNADIKSELKPYAKQILTEITTRDFKSIDDALEAIAKYPFSSTIEEPWEEYKASAEELADFIAYMCDQKHIYWDNTIRDPHGIEYFESTLLGKALLKVNGFLAASRSATSGVEPPISTSGVSSVTTTRSSSSRAGMPPKDDYKSSGGRSGDVRDLNGEPHDKTILTCPVMYVVEGKASTGTAPFAYIRPLEAAGETRGTNKVFFGTSWKAYRNFVCYFETFDEADQFRRYISSRYSISDDEIFVSKTKTDRNGYFLVGTEFGPVFTRAKELNEMLEDLVEATTIDEDDSDPDEGKLILEAGDFEEFAKWSKLYD